MDDPELAEKIKGLEEYVTTSKIMLDSSGIDITKEEALDFMKQIEESKCENMA